jgi:ribosomal protein L14E/L6E/L27E
MLGIYHFIKYWLKYSLSRYSRYKYLFLEIYKSQPTSLIEIGVYKGIRSLEMIKLLKNFKKKLFFYGFDLFEDITSKKIKMELSKRSIPVNQIKKNLSDNLKNENIHIKLIKGDTKKSLKRFKIKKKIDFVFIDGGHSIETIRNDWLNIQKLINKKSIVIFDDYYEDKKISKKFGCKKIIDNLDKKFEARIFPSTDFVKVKSKLTRNHLVKVIKRR